MPAKSVAQRKLMGMALHHPEKVSAKNKGILKMTRAQLHDYSDTEEDGLAYHVSDMKRKGKLKIKK
jgi:hypothetical protein